MDGWMDGRMHQQMGRETEGRIDQRTDRPLDGQTNGRRDGPMDRRINGRTDRQTDRQKGVISQDTVRLTSSIQKKWLNVSRALHNIATIFQLTSLQCWWSMKREPMAQIISVPYQSIKQVSTTTKKQLACWNNYKYLKALDEVND